jgi:hypothetical protein
MRLVDDWRRVASRSLFFGLLVAGILAMVLRNSGMGGQAATTILTSPGGRACCFLSPRSAAAASSRSVRSGFTSTTTNSRLPPTRNAPNTSTAFNCGVTAIGKSTATRRPNTGDIRGGCNALTWWDRTGNRVLRGLFEP